MGRRLEGLRWPFLVGLGASLPLLAVLVSGHTLIWRDTAQLYAPHRAAIVEAIRAFHLPVWNPWEAAGQPLFAQGLHAVLHPASVAVALLTSSTDALIVALVVLAATGTWVAARELGVSPAASAGAAFAFANSGFALSMSANVVFLVGIASGPWAIAGLVASARRPAGWIAAAAAVGALALSGDTGALVAFTLTGAMLAWTTARWRGIARAGLGAAFGVALAAVQLLPSWLYLADTPRGLGLLDPGSLRRWALAPWRILELVVPGFFVGVPRSYVAPVYSSLSGDASSGFPFAASVFVGAPVLLLALYGARKSVLARWLLGLAVLFIWLALGHHAGGQQLLAGVPVWGVLRYWEKMVGPLTLCLALAAGIGIETASERARALGRMAGVGAAVCGGAVLLLAVMPGPLAELGPQAAGSAQVHLQVGLGHAGAALAALAGAALLSRRWPRLFPAAVVGVFYFQSVVASPFALHAGNPAALAARPPALAAPAPGPRIVAPLGFDFAEGEGGLDAIDLLQNWEGRLGRPSTNVAAHVDSIATYSGLSSIRWEMIIGAGRLFWPLARRFGTTHVLARPPASEPEMDALRAATQGASGYQSLLDGKLLVWEIPHRDWASFAESVRAAPSLELAGAVLGEELVADRTTVVVETSAPPPISSGRVLSLARGLDEVVIEAESTGDALLVVNDAWAPGWTASIDGVPTEILPADVLVRAVRWPAGRHRLTMRYEAPGLAAGAVVSSLALALAAALLLVRRRRSA